MRPSGRLHLGNLLGALENWVALQADYDCIYCAVDIHALTDLRSVEQVHRIKPNVREMILDWLAAGIDPQRSIVFVQSHSPDVMTLHTILSMVTPLGWVMRVPTFKEKVRQMEETEENVSYGLLGYPVLQAADIILYKADTVPVGEDQVPHIELTREIARRFNRMFGDTFPEPQAKLSRAPVIVGLDGTNKMSKSLDNHIEIAAMPEETRKRILSAYTDPKRLKRSDPGHPEVCNVYSLHTLFSAGDAVTVEAECRNAARGCVECKRHLAESVNKYLEPLRERRRQYESKPGTIDEVLADGAARARTIAKQTIEEVTDRLSLP
jgi:tryptophanyl-tRNA synthetase